MSETESETGAEPTPGPYRRGVTSARNRVILTVHRDNGKAHGDLYSVRHPVEDKEPVANLQLAEKAFTAAQEAREMGYDSVAVQKALPKILSAAEELLERVKDDCRARNINPYDEPSFSALEYALKSAEGSGDE